MLVSYCQGFESCFGYLDEVEEVTVDGVPSNKEQEVPIDATYESVEIWSLDSLADGMNFNKAGSDLESE